MLYYLFLYELQFSFTQLATQCLLLHSDSVIIIEHCFLVFLANLECPTTFTYEPLPSKVLTQPRVRVNVSYIPYVEINKSDGKAKPALRSLGVHHEVDATIPFEASARLLIGEVDHWIHTQADPRRECDREERTLFEVQNGVGSCCRRTRAKSGS